MEHTDDASLFSRLRRARDDQGWTQGEVVDRMKKLLAEKWPNKAFGIDENMVYRHEANINKPGKEYRWGYTQLYGESEEALDILPRPRIKTKQRRRSEETSSIISSDHKAEQPLTIVGNLLHRNDFFTGREEELKKLQDGLSQKKPSGQRMRGSSSSPALL